MRTRNLIAAFVVLGLSAAAQAELIYGVTTANGTSGATLVNFDSATPHVQTTVGAITGVNDLRGIDFRPATGELYGLGYTATAGATTGVGQVYTIDITTGAATAVGGPLTLPLGNTTRVSLDWNPTVDRLRVVSGAGGNIRLTPTGTLGGTDTALPAALLVGAIAYTNNVPTATTTTLYAYEYLGDNIGRIGSPSPNDGTFTVVGPIAPVSAFSADNGMDISGATGIAYLTLDDGPSATAQDELYTVDLTTGALSIVGTPNLDSEIGVNLLDLSVLPVIPEPTSLATLALGGLLLKRRRA